MLAPLLLSAALAAASPQPQTEAFTGQAPVAITACNLTTPLNVPAAFGLDTPSAGSIAISFRNQNTKPIASVAFDVTSGVAKNRIVDMGTFSTGVEIDHRFSVPAFSNTLGDVSCTVTSVAFADGTTWQAQ
jgi:hypothetical protein